MAAEQYLAIRSPLANLRRKPVEARPGHAHDDLQESQLLCNEVLLLLEEQGDWLRVEALEQRKYTHGRGWHGYPGWVNRRHCVQVEKISSYDAVIRGKVGRFLSHPSMDASPLFLLPLGARVSVSERAAGYARVGLHDGTIGWVSGEELSFRAALEGTELAGREKIVASGQMFIGAPYLWGGRCLPFAGCGSVACGVDCSGLTNLVFRAHHLNLPRDARDQWQASLELAPETMEPADLIFTSQARRCDDVTHVMLYIGDDRFIEAAETGGFVRINSFTGKFGLSRRQIAGRGGVAKDKRVYFRRVKRLAGLVTDHDD